MLTNYMAKVSLIFIIYIKNAHFFFTKQVVDLVNIHAITILLLRFTINGIYSHLRINLDS